jgi:hypothetical protein
MPEVLDHEFWHSHFTAELWIGNSISQTNSGKKLNPVNILSNFIITSKDELGVFSFSFDLGN